MNNQDFLVGVDFTGIPNPGGADLNNGVELATPLLDAGDETQGKGLVLRTTDSALDTPVVPDASITVKWKRYTWKRRPFAGAADKFTKSYDWNDDAVNVAIFLKWVEQSVDLTAVTAVADNALATANSAVAIADVANDTANSATNQVGAANANATAAVNTATAANATSIAANTAATTAIAAAANALTVANNGVALNTTPIAVDLRLSPNAFPFAEIRTSQGANSVEWFQRRTYYGKYTEAYAKNTDNPTAPAVGKNTRVLNTSDNNIGGFVTLDPLTGLLTCHVAGYYKFRGWSIVERSGAAAINHQLIIANNATDATLLTGSANAIANCNANNNIAMIEGMVSLAFNQVIRLDHYLSTATSVVLGKATNVHPDAGGHEIYASLEIEFLGFA
jgi:hypothetical protein